MTQFEAAKPRKRLSQRLGAVAARGAGFVCMAFLMGWAMDASARLARPDRPAGFWWGLVHGALMPGALPTLLTGRDVAIYAPHNLGVSYKIGYTMGVNGCGLLFFGLAFWKPAPRPVTNQ